MAGNPLFRVSNSPTKTTRPTKVVNETPTSIRLTHNTFDNSFFNFKTQRYGLYEPFWWKVCVPGDNEPFSNSHNVRSLPFASPILSPMKLNKDYFQVPMYAIQPNTWDYIFKSPTQGDDVPSDVQNLFPLVGGESETSSFLYLFRQAFQSIISISSTDNPSGLTSAQLSSLILFFMYENFLSSGSLLFNLGFKINLLFGNYTSPEKLYSYDEMYDIISRTYEWTATYRLDDPDHPSGYRDVSFITYNDGSVDLPDSNLFLVDRFTFFSLFRSLIGSLIDFNVFNYDQVGDSPFENYFIASDYPIGDGVTESPGNCLRMDTILAYQLACSQYYVNPRVDFLYNAQLYRDNFIQLLRELRAASLSQSVAVIDIASFDYNGIPVLYDYFSEYYFRYVSEELFNTHVLDGTNQFEYSVALARVIYYLFGYQEQLKFGDYLQDSRTQALGYGEPGSDIVDVMDQGVSVVDLSQKLVLNRYRSAVAHLDNTAEDYLETMFHENLPPDFHYPKYIVHSEFAIDGNEVANTTSDDQGNLVTNLKSGDDTAEFSIDISVPSILIGISYISIPQVYSQIKERHYMHVDRYDMFQPMLQYFGDQGIYNREVSDDIPNPGDSYGYTSRNGEYKQRLSQVSGGFLNALRSWVFIADAPLFLPDIQSPRLSNTQSPLAIRAHDFEFNRFLRRQTGISLGTGFHFIMQYNNKNVDNRPMDINPLPLYPSNSL